MPDLIVIYGAPLSGKSTLAREVAQRLEGKTAVVSTDQLLKEAIVQPDTDRISEIDLVYTQLRLLVASYLKSRYNVVVEGVFYHEHEGRLHPFDPEVDQMLALMRNMAPRGLIVRLEAGAELLEARAAAAGAEPGPARRIDAVVAAKQRYGDRFLRLEAASASADPVIEALGRII